MTAAYYNEIDPYAAQWLRNLITAGHIAPGDVDERSIVDVRPSDLIGYDQCHFFAGIGVWSHALRLAGWPDGEAVWTGSCPCQPFSSAGDKGGFDDERHLWPAWFDLIRQCRPGVVFGEQVASAPGLAWLDLVHSDMEAEGYAVGAVDLCAAGLGAPHIRQRLWFVAHPEREQLRAGGSGSAEQAPPGVQGADGERERLRDDAGEHRSLAGPLGHAGGSRREGDGLQPLQANSRGGEQIESSAGSGATRGFWQSADWLPCIDGKARPVEPGTFPLAHGITNRVGRLRAYGNAIVAPVAAEVVRAYRSLR